MIKRVVCTVLFALVTLSAGTVADDTELYVFESSSRTGDRPKVLIIFDNSGSMSTMEKVTPVSSAGYDPLYVQSDGTSGYPSLGGSDSVSENRIYYVRGSSSDIPNPNSSDEKRFFKASLNGCNMSKSLLTEHGTFTGYMRRYRTKSGTGTWKPFSKDNGRSIKVADCWEDIAASDPLNAPSVDSGFPVDALSVNRKPYPYRHVNSPADSEWDNVIADAKETQFGTGDAVKLYTTDYLRWYQLSKDAGSGTVEKSRLDIAQEAISNIISTTPSVDFGLAVFNYNSDGDGEHGGRIVSGIETMTDSSRSSLITKIKYLSSDNWTPLCETLFEAYNYFSGGNITYGHLDASATPAYDENVEKDGSYISPLKVCPDLAYIIYVTDGAPSHDEDANEHVKTLTKEANSDGDYSAYYARTYDDWADSYMPALASYMYHNDVAHSLDDNGEDLEQNVRTFTIGFSDGAADAASLLTETAFRGGGEYLTASSGIELEEALSDALSAILAIDSTFTSPSIASNNFDRTQTFDSAYYAMFLPSNGPRWSGNLKKLKVTSGGVLTDATGAAAISDNGNIKASACTYWSRCASEKDGNKVEQGGAAESLREADSRKLLSNASGGLKALTVGNVASGDISAFATYMNTTEAELENSISWLKGVDVDDENEDESIVDKRQDIIGDPLHSKPLAINFGTKVTPDIRILLGTNQGVLHMFKDIGSSVSESWGFIPYELLPNITKLRNNTPSGGHYVYGMDAAPVAYIKTKASGEGIEKAWVFAGMRRGGSSYYALDVTTPDNPSFMWSISPDSVGFSDLGQTWSEPIVTTIPGHTKPVLIFGGGYDVSYDSTPSLLPKGRSVYIVDAETGVLLHSFGATLGSGVTQLPGITDSIATSLAVLDSNNDGTTDRIYASDVGGNIWRMDMPSDSRSEWTAFKFADVGGSISSTDRRFFAEPIVAQTVFNNISEVSVTETDTSGNESVTTKITYQNVPYDAVSIGTGNRPHPSGLEVADMYYVFQDRNVISQSFDGSSNPIPDTITLNELYNVTSTPPATDAENLVFGSKRGWYYDFSSLGEKSLAAGLIIDGKVYFTSYIPPAQGVTERLCTVSGEGRLYVFDLHKGTRTSHQLFYELGERVPDTPQIVIPAPESGEEPYIYIIGVGTGEIKDGEATGTINVGSGLGVNKIYYHIDE